MQALVLISLMVTDTIRLNFKLFVAQFYDNNISCYFQAALVLLWDLMVVNNWHVFLKEYATVVNG